MRTAVRVASSSLIALALAACGGAGCGGAGAAASTRAAPDPDRCLVALRFAGGDEAPVEGPEIPRTMVSLVRICDRDGRVVAPIGELEGVCQHAEPAADAWIAARCWWPGHGARGLRVVAEGPTVTALGADEDAEGALLGALEPLTSIELPRGARVDVLAPERRRVRGMSR